MKIGILAISYGARGASIVDALDKSKHDVDLYVVDKQNNPFNLEKSTEHRVIPDLDVDKIVEFAKKHENNIRFGLVGPEGPIIDGVRDKIEKNTSIQMVCPTSEFAIEASKVRQRELLEEIFPEMNPEFKVFDPDDYSSKMEAKKDLFEYLDEIGDEVAVKPDTPAAGKGVGVWGDHFDSRDELFENYFYPNLEDGMVIIERKIDGEEFSVQFFSDGDHLVETPSVRDYKRAFEGDEGPNTGGMGSYKSKNNILPFMSEEDWEKSLEVGKKLHNKLKNGDFNSGLKGLSIYIGFIIGSNGLKVLEINSRPGDPEMINIMPLLENDFVEICLDILESNLKALDFMDKASVVTYKVPWEYGRDEKYKGDKEVDLTDALKMKEQYGNQLRIYPADLELKDEETYSISSRTVCAVGIADTIEKARKISQKAISEIKGSELRYREDIASEEHINKSIDNLRRLTK